MKKTTIIGCLLSTMCVTYLSAAPLGVPSVTKPVGSSANHGSDAQNASPKASKASSSSVAIQLTPVLLPNINSPSWTAAANALIADVLSGTLATNRSVTAPTQYAVCDGQIGWTNLVLSESTPMWGGMLNPIAPFNAELGGPLLWVLVDEQSLSGGNTVSLSTLSVQSTSNDGNVLGSTISFANDSYTARAVCVQANGTVITSGTDTVQGKRVVSLIEMAIFNGGDTQPGLDQVDNWVGSHNPYVVNFLAQTVGDSSTLSTASVSTGAATTAQPILSISASSGAAMLSVSNASTGSSYRVWSSPSLNPATWALAGVITGTNVLMVASSGQSFFRASLQ